MRLEAGRRFAPTRATVDAETQARCLGALALSPVCFGDAVAPALLGNECYRALRAAGVSIDGWVETDLRLDQRDAARLGEPLALSFHVAEGAPHARGWRIRIEFEFTRPHAAPLMRLSLGAIQAEPRAARPAAAAPAPDFAGLTEAAALTLTPKAVLDFSTYVGNEIHLDPDFARSQGFRAPVAQGLMTTALMTGALQAAQRYRRLDARVRYLRPVFWDDALTLWRDADWRRLVVLAGGRRAAEAEIAEAAP